MPDETVDPAATPRRPKACPVCGGDKLMQVSRARMGMPGSSEWNLNISEAPNLYISGKARKFGTGASWVDTIRTSSDVTPVVCGDCGYILWFADKPQELWRVWSSTRR